MAAAASGSSSAEGLPATVEGQWTLTLSGRLDAAETARLWAGTLAELEQGRAGGRRVRVDASGVTYCDGAGMGLLLELRRRAAGAGLEFEVAGLPENLRRILDLYPAEKFAGTAERGEKRRVIEEIGAATMDVVRYGHDVLAFTGELVVETGKMLAHPGRFRWRDALLAVEKAGANGLPIVALLGFLFGLILAFQSAIPLQRFGAELYVADLVAIALLRELGPILTAVILAGRSASAFAAELGTMKVREEIDALTTMGLSPVRFLVLPRVMAGVAVTPLLTVFCNLMGLMGAAVVIRLLGYPLATFVNQVVGSVTFLDLINGLGKAAVFGLLISSVGCMQGLAAGRGASAVGDTTTRAVVAGMVLIIVADGVFAVVSYALGV
jgi:phospholipid/cholesterol/gamma-HCH transport system permease protein